jgi:hypothetical protein
MSRLARYGWMSAVVAGLLAVGAAAADEPAFPAPPKPGPEFAALKKLVGTWDTTMRMGGNESKGTATYQLECGGLWLVSNFKGSFGGQPFQGRGLDSYDAAKKKYVSVWVDSMGATVMIMEGTYNPKAKTMTMVSTYLTDSTLPKFKNVSRWKDDDTIEWAMAAVGPDGQEKPVMTMTYKRRTDGQR